MSVQFSAASRLGAFSFEASLSAEEEILVLFGHSGAGKSLTLQFIAGLLKPGTGRIVIDGRTVFDSGERINLSPQERGVGYVVQALALFPHLTVAENVAFGMPRRGSDRRKRTAELLGMLGLEDYADRKPATLSGGQQQRVALARALGRDARLLLLDEPFSALDESLRRGLRKELLRLRAELGLSILFVTHDLREAHYLGDRLAVFDAGRLLQVGPRDEVFRRPQSRRVGELTGVTNIWEGSVVGADADAIHVEVEGLVLHCARTEAIPSFRTGERVDVMVRSERIAMRRDHQNGPGIANRMVGRIVEESPFGSAHILQFDPEGPGPSLEVELPSRPYEVLGVESRKVWTLEIDPDDLTVVPAPEA